MDRERLKRDVERIETHRQEKADVAKSEREIFAALKSDGFNCKVVREILKRRGMDDSDGWDAEVATYEAAVEGVVLAAAAVRAGASIRIAADAHDVSPSDVHRHLAATVAVPETQVLEQSPTRRDPDAVTRMPNVPAPQTDPWIEAERAMQHLRDLSERKHLERLAGVIAR